MKVPPVKPLAPHYVVWLAAICLVAGCVGARSGDSGAGVSPGASVVAATPGAVPSESPVTTPVPAESDAPSPSPAGAAEPPTAVLTGTGDGPARGDLGSFSWDGLVSDSPWIVSSSGPVADAGHRLRVRFAPAVDATGWIARWAPVRHGQAGRPRLAGAGGSQRIVVEAPDAVGPWSLQLDARFADGRRATWYWRVEVGG